MITIKSSKKVIEESDNLLATTTRDSDLFPLVIDHGEGVWIYDIDGNRFLDFTSGIGVNNLGWPSHPEVIKIGIEQMQKLAHAASNDFYNIQQLELAKKLVSLSPGNFEKKVFFSNSGTEAIEASIKLVKSVEEKRKYLISFIGGFHGRTFGSLSLTASKPIQKARVGPLMPGVYYVPYPNPFRNPWHINGYEEPEELVNRVIEYLEEWVFGHLVPADEVSAIFYEPIQGEGGYIVPPKNFFRELEKLAKKYGIYLVDDEVQMGIGRTGKLFAIENFDGEPDVITLAKALGGGIMPIGATIFRKELDFKEGIHSNTFGGNALATAIGSKVIDIAKDLLPHIKEMEKIFKEELSNMKVDDVRGIGLAWGIEFIKEDRKPDVKTRNKVIEEAFKNGLLLLPAGESSIRIIPPLVIEEDEAKEGLNKLRKIINSIR